MGNYDHQDIEKKWRERWAKSGLSRTPAEIDPKAPKCYVLDMFPYPSGEGLHVGHPKGYIASDVYARYMRMRGASVLHPMGWDAFGLPAENYAIKNKTHPSKAVAKNVARYKEQLEQIGFSYDWTREINTTDPAYYKWTQWIFLKLFEKGLAFESYEPINWCPSCQTGLANEDLEDGKCERCGSVVEKKPMRQWVLRIRDYADRMLEDIDALNWPDAIKESQRNWIGKSEGAEIDFALATPDGGSLATVTAFTTRPDTLFGATYLVLAPEHPLLAELLPKAKNAAAIRAYQTTAAVKTEIDRTAEGKEKTGVQIDGVVAINPANNEKLPVFVADYVLAHYGTGAIMAVPAHDERDGAFADAFSLPKRIVVTSDAAHASKDVSTPYCGSGTLVDCGEFTGMSSEDAKRAIAGKVGGRITNTYKLRDWVFSRQRYWGEPIPIVHCAACGAKKQKALIVHGFDSDPTDVWFPWLRAKLEEAGFEVIAPELPDPKHPDLAKWLAVIEPVLAEFGEDDIAITHSLGSKALLHALEKRSKNPLKHIFLVASAIGERESRDWKDIKKRMEGKGVDVDALERFWMAPLDTDRAGTMAHAVTLLISDDDELIPKKTRGSLPRDWQFKIWKGFGHFRAQASPELLSEILRAKRTDAVAVPITDLPVELPNVESYAPTGTGESPLADISDWVNTTCPRCGGPAKRETNTMPQWAGSSWYYLRYIDPSNADALVDPAKESYWSPVDLYVGGAEHATRHLIYARFWHKFLYDQGVVSHIEPFTRLQHVGLIMASDGRKMSKRYGNVINPDEIVAAFGADTLRVYEMFMGPFAQAIAWNTDNMMGARRFLDRVNDAVLAWITTNRIATDPETAVILEKSIAKVGADIEQFSFNTAISQMMILLNTARKENGLALDRAGLEIFLKLLAPFAPHLAEELWEKIGNTGSIHASTWPTYDPTRAQDAHAIIAIQVNGKLRATLTVDSDAQADAVLAEAIRMPEVSRWLEGKTIAKHIFVPGRILNILVSDKSAS
ncbi:MAG TPA: leucine--tRNA ligase [Candidatus Paceibacterota bacterium]|nr:leucine--tRNA ligase [Candidatus Paceibacterota bacterium]